MKKTRFQQLAIGALALAAVFTSCNKDDDYVPKIPSVTMVGIDSQSPEVAQDDTLSLTAHVTSELTSTITWKVNGTIASTSDSVYKFVSSAVGNYSIMAVVHNADGDDSVSVNVNVYGKFRDGVFILNEGNMTSENGSLIFISPKGSIIDSAYYKVNGTFLGNVTQDLFIADKKMYIIAQNGNRMGGDGTLVVANAETLKKEAAFNDEVSKLSWPTHIAVVGSTAYIRDNNGVYTFDLSSKALAFVDGSKGAQKNRMAVVGKKVFVPASKSIYVMEDGVMKDTIKLAAAVSGVLKAKDGNLWVSCTSSPAKILKVNPSTYATIEEHELPVEAKVGAGWGATPGISAKGDTIYFSNAGVKIYRHIFSANKTELMGSVKDEIADANIVYNNLAVDPSTGKVYFNSIKGYGTNFLINDISVWNDNGSSISLAKDYKDHTHFPAGIFFTASFK